MITPDSDRPIAYLTGEYPRPTDTFIQREVMMLRLLGNSVVTLSIRQASFAELQDCNQRREHRQTFVVLRAARNPAYLLYCLVRAAFQTPGRLLNAVVAAVKTCPPTLRGIIYQVFYFAESLVLGHHLRKIKARHIHNHFADSSCNVAILASIISDVPFSFTIHGPGEFFNVNHWALREKIRMARFVVCISNYCKSQTMLFSDFADWPKLRIVHCGVELPKYEHARRRLNGDGAKAEQTLLFVGRLAAAKGLLVLLEAFAALRHSHPDVMLVLIGDGPERSLLESRVSQLELSSRVKFKGYLSQKDIADALAEADVFVLPSFAEGVPIVLMEAMASRVPVVTTGIAGIPELVEDGISGFIVPPGDSDSLAMRLRQLLDDPAMRRRFGEAGRVRVAAEFDITRSAEALDALFRAS
jgi:glycosyltransferase involved in cell wall biosynthesis